MSEQAFTVPPAADRGRRLRVLNGADADPAQAATDDELRTVLVALVDCVVGRWGSVEKSPELPKQLWTVEQLSKWSQVPETTLLEYARDRKIPSVRLGKHVRFDPRAVLSAVGESE